MSLSDNRLCWNISSLSEMKLKKLYDSNLEELTKFHRKNFTRIYPAGFRVNSSNYDPIPGFLVGSQIVALNQQTCDRNLMIYLGKFQENGGMSSGYLLKP